ncbi:hypothetical protein Lesp02_07750 [Lentzea sp. NBRC 105346]|uniref:hypothetical protein n=1 Tax=Lentzea sp. NBRC 105346 TaxID=3032205 RepID=UPI0024A1E6AD|nr:hypothetical protein [Lentzea sp. NBRC 105346]GLZ28585.1 hypothetical protein Lesp02_07750 [Lentzea sp. NBRC 105346]
MSTEVPSSPGEPHAATHVTADPTLMADARARITARWQAPAELPAAAAATRERKFKLPVIAVAGALLVGAAVITGTLVSGGSPEPPPATAQTTEPNGGYVPGVMTPDPNLIGQFSSSPVPLTSVPPTSEAPPAPGTPGTPGTPAQGVKAPPSFSGTAGPGCGGFAGVGSYRDGREGWVDHGSGCGSAFVSIPMSGDANKDDSSAFGLWTFSTGPISSGSCSLSVYIPNGSLEEVGGNPTSYRVFDGDRPSGSPIGSFVIKQVDQRGKWVGTGTFSVRSGKLAVQLLSRGQDWNSSGPTYAHHAASAVKAECRA